MEINRKGLELLGYRRDEVVGQNWFDKFLPEDEKQSVRAEFLEMVKGKRGVRENEENRVLTKRGDLPLVRWTSQTFTDAKGKVTTALSSGVDITEQRRAEQYLKLSEQRFRDFGAASSDYFWEMDSELRFSWFSDRFSQVTGVAAESLLGKTREETGIPDVDPDAWDQHLSDLRNRRPFRGFIHPRTLPDGRKVWLSINGLPVYDERGGFQGYRGTGGDVTELVETGVALQESEEKYRKIFETESDAIMLSDAESMQILDANEAALDLFGYSRDEFLQLTMPETSAEPKLTVKAFEKIRREGSGYIDRRLKKHKDGSEFPVALSTTSFMLDNRQVLCCVARDLREEEQQQRALIESEKRFRSFVDNLPAETYVKDLDGRYRFANRHMREFLGLTEDEIYGKTVTDLYPAEIAEPVLVQDKEVLTKQRTVIRESVETWPEATHTFLAVKFPVFNASGQIASLGGLTQDISALARTRRALKESEQRFKDFAEIAADYFWETDADDRFIYFSDSFEDVRGLPPETLLGETPREAIPRDIKEDVGWGEYRSAIRARRAFSMEISRRRPDRSMVRLLTTGRPVFSEDGTFRGYRGATRDITDQHRLSEKLTYQATHDALTGLVNRVTFEERLNRVLASTHADGSEHALCYLDLDQFKVINDTCGHVAGDELLRGLCMRLRATVRRRDTLARLGGDEFGVLMEHCNLDQAARVADALRKAVAEFQFVWKSKTFRIGASIGLVPLNSNSESAAAVLSAADAACYVAKEQGRNRVYVSRGDDARLNQRHREMEWVSQINGALAEERLQLLARPILSMSNGNEQGHHYELLLRMIDQDGESIPPGAFLPAAERYNLSSTLDRWVVHTALEWLSRNPSHLENLDMCAINLSGHSLADGDFLPFLSVELDKSRVPASKLCFEVTESVAIANLATATPFIEGVQARGGRFALDDFGSGLASFAFLRALPVEFLKIDGEFVKHITSSPLDESLVKSINEVGHVMGKKTIAEFVENDAIMEAVRRVGVDYAQGDAVGKPAPLTTLT
jgi:diguanylate cyclase (GGDEF)-like protein/PAS domain S-box-containing protein